MIGKRGVVSALSVAGGLSVWELSSRGFPALALLLPPPSRVLGRLGLLTCSSQFWAQAGATAGHALAGFAAGASAGLLAAVLCSRWPRLDAVLDPWVDAVYPLPKLALALPLLILFGPGGEICVVLSALTVFFNVFIPCRAGISRIDPTLVEAARSLGADKAAMFREVTLPAISPFLFVAAYSGVLSALTISIVAEMLLSAPGLGRALWLSGSWYDLETYFAYVVAVAAMGILLAAGVRRLRRLCLPWDPETDGS